VPVKLTKKASDARGARNKTAIEISELQQTMKWPFAIDLNGMVIRKEAP
tara:strand:- start:301 stop:447 length:147 start_codon:yes stop_codon:yes gene_type:complete